MVSLDNDPVTNQDTHDRDGVELLDRGISDSSVDKQLLRGLFDKQRLMPQIELE